MKLINITKRTLALKKITETKKAIEEISDYISDVYYDGYDEGYDDGKQKGISIMKNVMEILTDPYAILDGTIKTIYGTENINDILRFNEAKDIIEMYDNYISEVNNIVVKKCPKCKNSALGLPNTTVCDKCILGNRFEKDSNMEG